MIKRLVVHRFRGIRKGVLDDIGKVNLLIGPNNSGKTAVLEMLYLAGVCGRECSVLTPDVEPSAWAAHTLNRYDFLGEEPLPRLRKRHGRPKKWTESPAVLTDEYNLDVELKQLPEEYPLRRFTLSAPPEEGARKRIFFKKDESDISLFRFSPQKEVAVSEPMMPSFFDEQKVSLETAHWTYLWEEPWVYKWDQDAGIDHLAVWAVEGEMPSPEHVLFFDFHTANGHFSKRFTQAAKATVPDWYEKISASLGHVFPELQSAEVEIDDAPGTTQRKTGYVRFRGKTPIGIDHFGDGARHAFKVLAALIALVEMSNDEQPGLFLWEDPELFMHPATLSRLLQEILKLVENKPVQVFMTSQSLEVLASFVKEVEGNHPLTSGIRMFRLDIQAGALQVQKFVGKGLASWFHLFGDPRLSAEEEMTSPLYYLLAGGERDAD